MTRKTFGNCIHVRDIWYTRVLCPFHFCRFIFTARKRSLGQGYVFTRVCYSLHKGGREVPGQVPPPPGRYTPQAGTPPGRYTPGQVHPPRQVHPLAGTPPPAGTPTSKYTPRQVHPSPLWQVHPQAGTSPRQVHHLGRYTSWAGTPSLRQVHPPNNACWDTFNKRAVCILLECILV